MFAVRSEHIDTRSEGWANMAAGQPQASTRPDSVRTFCASDAEDRGPIRDTGAGGNVNGDRTTSAAPTLDEVKSWPVTVEVRRACRAIGISSSWGYQLIALDEFPCRVIKIGHRSRVVTASLLALLESA